MTINQGNGDKSVYEVATNYSCGDKPDYKNSNGLAVRNFRTAGSVEVACRHIEGEITIDEAQKLIETRYQK